MTANPIQIIKNLLRNIFNSGQFIIWKLIGIFKSGGGSPLPADKNWQRILIIQLNAIGDLVMTTPAISCLRQRYKNAQLDALVRPHTKEILLHNPGLNNIYVIEKQTRQQKCLKPGTVFNLINTIRFLRKNNYELCIDFSGQFYSAWLSFLIGAQHRIGLMRTLKLGWFKMCGFDYLYTHELPVDDGSYIVEQNIRLLAPLDCTQSLAKPEVFPQAADFDYIDRLLKQAGISAKDTLICIHPGAKWPPKRWPVEYYRELIRRLTGQNCRVLLIGKGDEEPTQKIIDRATDKITNLTDKLSLLQTAAIIKRSRLFIGNDSGPMHLAAAMGTPSVLFFGPVAPETSAPRQSDTLILYKKSSCSPCTIYYTKDTCQQGDNICLKTITVDEAWEAVSRQLGFI
jgi:predicted lipopolysaccharide heptosyltransferase III